MKKGAVHFQQRPLFESSLASIYENNLREPSHMTRASHPLRFNDSTNIAGCALYSFFGLICTILGVDAIVFEQAAPPWPVGELGAERGGPVFALLGALILINAVLFDSLMAGKVTDRRLVPDWVRVVRFTLAGVPLIGIYAVMAWLWLLENHPHRVLREQPPPTLRARRVEPPREVSRPRRYGVVFRSRVQMLTLAPYFFVGLLIVNTLVLRICATWWCSFGADFHGIRSGVLVSVALHAVAFACAVSYVLSQRRLLVLRPLRRLLVWPLTFFWWLPSDWFILGGLIVTVIGSAEEQRLLVRAAFRGRRQWTEMGMEIYSYLRRSARRPSPGTPPAWSRETLKHQRRFYRLKLALLAAEAMLATTGVSWLLERLGPPKQLVNWSIVLMLFLSVLCAVAGVGFFLFDRLVRQVLARPPYFRYAFGGQIVFAAGSQLGIYLGSGDLAAFCDSLFFFSCIGFVVAGLAVIFSRPLSRDSGLLFWCGAFLALAAWAIWRPGAALLAALGAFLFILGLLVLLLVIVGTGIFQGSWVLLPWTLASLKDRRLRFRSRAALGILAISLILPFGGFLIPLWYFARQHLCPALEQELLAASPAAVRGRDGDAAAARSSGKAVGSSSEQRNSDNDFAFRQLIHHLMSTGTEHSLWRLLETKTYFADQARYLGSFHQSSNDLEEAVLPTAIRTGDWNRFLHYALVALNLRSLADRLSEEELLGILVRRGYTELALDAAGRLADQFRRLNARTAIGIHLDRTGRHFAELLEPLREDLENLPPPKDKTSADRSRGILIELARAFGLELEVALERQADTWPEALWTRGLNDELWVAAAWGCLGRSAGKPGEDTWFFLAKVHSPEVVSNHLPEMLASVKDIEDAEEILTRVRALETVGEELLWRCRLALLSNLSNRQPEVARDLWRRWRQPSPVPWSTDLVVLGADFLGHQPQKELEHLVADIRDVEARVALWLAGLYGRKARGEAAGIEGMAASARAAIDALPQAEQPGWMLLWISAVHTFPVPGLGVELVRLETLLRQTAYAASGEMMTTFFDLAAVLSPRHLRVWLADAILTSTHGSELLLVLAERASEEGVLKTLWQHSESYLLGLTLSTDEATALWTQILTTLASRLTVLCRDLFYLEEACSKVRDEDALRAAAVAALADAGQTELAARVCAGINGSRERRLAELRFLSGTAAIEEPLVLDELYEALASVDEAEDEMKILASLSSPERSIETLFRRWLASLVHHHRQVPALIRLLEHRAGGSGVARREQRVGWHILEKAMANSPPDSSLVALVPELPVLSRPLGMDRAATEVYESFRQLLRLTQIPWSDRRWALESLLARIDAIFFARPSRPSGRAWRVAELFRALAAELFTVDEPLEAREQLLPPLVAVVERLPPEVARHLRHLRPSRRLSKGWLSLGVGHGSRPDALAESRILSFYMAGDAQRLSSARRLLTDPGTSPREVQVLAYLLSNRNPEMVPALVAILPASMERDDLSLRLIRHGWIAGEMAGDLLDQIHDPLLNLEGNLWRDLEANGGNAEETWCQKLTAFVAQRDLDPDDLRYEPWLRALREEGSGRGLPDLAEAFRRTLASGSTGRAWCTLRTWLHAREGGNGPSQGTSDAREFALRRALRLSPTHGAIRDRC